VIGSPPYLRMFAAIRIVSIMYCGLYVVSISSFVVG
jgi:hypothetical protein